MKKLNIILDIDDVVADWIPAFCERYKCPLPSTWVNPSITMERLNELKKDKDFWVSLPVKHLPNFKPNGFLSARSIPKKWTYQFMKLNNISGRSNINQVPWNVSKIEKLKLLKADIFIDDKVETFEDCHKAGIFCLLMDACHNQEVNTPYRIHNLDIKTIIKKYKEWRESK